jgi:N6-adenosine-specific RNA methylase IME4
MIIKELPQDRKYKAILADPPYRYDNVNTGGSMKSGAASHYETMNFHQLLEMSEKVMQASTRDSILFLWCTSPLLPYAIEIVKKWGYKYKASIYWIKEGKLGMGFWWRNQVEICLIGISGKVTPFRSSERNLIVTKPRLHSQKPEEFFQLIEPALDRFDLSPRLEMFAREEREGWDAWGLEIEKGGN